MKMKATNQIIQILKDSNVQINYTNHQIKPSILHPPLHFTPLLNTTIFQNQEIKGCILGHLLDFVFRDVHLTMAYCLDFLGILCFMETCLASFLVTCLAYYPPWVLLSLETLGIVLRASWLCPWRLTWIPSWRIA